MFDCIHANKLFCIYGKIEEIVQKLSRGYIYNLMDEHNELKELMERLYLSCAASFDEKDIAIKKLELFKK